MNYITHLNGFFLLQEKERHLNACQVSLYMALFHHWNRNRFNSPFRLRRKELMRLSGIGSKSTYMQGLSKLDALGYITYVPASLPFSEPKVVLYPYVGDVGPQSAGKDKTGTRSVPDPVNSGPGNDIAVVPDPVRFNKPVTNNEENRRAAHAPIPGIPPSMEAVFTWFAEASYPENEAIRFFNHYNANGWKQGRGRPITNWMAAAAKWISYIGDMKPRHQPRTDQANNDVNNNENKDYGSPL